jgi:hypothetical protein
MKPDDEITKVFLNLKRGENWREGNKLLGYLVDE